MSRGKLSKTDARKLSKELQTEIRRRAVSAVKKGKRKKEVAECYGVSRRVVTKWCKREAVEGYKGLEGDQRGLPIGIKGKLKNIQKNELIEIIKNKLPDDMGLSTQLWTRKSIAKLIQKKYKVSYSLQTISKLLIRNNFTPQKAYL